MNALHLVRRSPVIPVLSMPEFVLLYVDQQFADRVVIKDGLPLVDVMRVGAKLGMTFEIETFGTEPRVIGWLPGRGPVDVEFDFSALAVAS